MAKKVIVYTMKDDPHSLKVSSLLDEMKVSFEERDVSENEKLVNELVEKTGQWSVPALVVQEDDSSEHVIVGNDPQSIRTLFESDK